MPGILSFPAPCPTSVDSSWVRRFAADPTPRSAVCRNQPGSFEANDSAIWVLDSSGASSLAGSGVARGERAAFSAASMDSGLRPLLDFGRCCHESVPERERGRGELLLLSGIVSASGWEVDAGLFIRSGGGGVGDERFSGERERARSIGWQSVSARPSTRRCPSIITAHLLDEPCVPLGF